MGGRRQCWIPTTITLVLALLAAACSGGGDNDQTGGTATPARGGVFRTATTDFSFPNAFDPTGEYSARGFNLYAALLRTLVSFRHVGGPPGDELQPDLATEVPEPTDNGLTYTFKLKPNTGSSSRPGTSSTA